MSAEITIIRNKFFYLNVWNYMLLHNLATCVDIGGEEYTRESVANILHEKYGHSVMDYAKQGS